MLVFHLWTYYGILDSDSDWSECLFSYLDFDSKQYLLSEECEVSNRTEEKRKGEEIEKWYLSVNCCLYMHLYT